MDIKPFTMNDYETVGNWWKAQGWPVISPTSLSDTGFIVYENEVQILAGWVYKTNSDICLLEFIVANPEVRGEQRDQAFDLLFNVVSEYAKIFKFKSIFTSVENKGLMKRLEKNDFKVMDKNMTNYLRSL